MATIVKSKDAKATWNEEENCWKSDVLAFENTLNDYLEENKPPDGANPWPAGVAVELAKKQIKDLEVVKMDKQPEYDNDAVY